MRDRKIIKKTTSMSIALCPFFCSFDVSKSVGFITAPFPIPNLVFGVTIFFFANLTLMPLFGVINATDLEIFNQLFDKIKGVRVLLKVFIAYETRILKQKQKHKN